MPNFFNLGTYARVLLYRNAEGRSDAAAMADAWKVLHFTEQIQLQGHSQLEDLITANITIEACKQLEPLLQKAGRGEEAGLVAFESDRWKIELERLKSRNMTVGDSTGSLVWAAVTMHLAVTAIALFGVLSLVGLALLAWPKNKADGWLSVFCSAAVDWAPAMLATACLALFAAYHPYSRTYQTYFQDKAPSINAESMETLVAAAGVPSFLTDGMQTGFRDPIVAYTGWMAVTVVLTIATVLLMIHAWKRRLV